jgi:ABC-type Zn uptake system ZnuABC Zn-binding protein ZnuA
VKKGISIGVIGVLVSALVFASLPVTCADANKLSVVCTTSVLGSFAEEIGGEHIEVTSIVPAGICPGHYDLKPSDVVAVSNAALIFRHGMEQSFSWFNDMLGASGNEEVQIVTVSGDWNAPPLAVEEVHVISNILCAIDPGNATDYTENEEEMCESINVSGQQIREEADRLNVNDVKVICMTWQQPFVNWTGFDIVATYGPPESLSLNDVAELIDIGKQEDVTLVIDNYQSGTDFGAGLAADVGATQVVLTNFPGAISGTETYTKMIEYNAGQLFDALE